MTLFLLDGLQLVLEMYGYIYIMHLGVQTPLINSETVTSKIDASV